MLAFFRVNPAKSVNQPDFFFRSACFDLSSGQSRVNPGKGTGGRTKQIEKSASFLFEVSCSQRRLFELALSVSLAECLQLQLVANCKPLQTTVSAYSFWVGVARGQPARGSRYLEGGPVMYIYSIYRGCIRYRILLES